MVFFLRFQVLESLPSPGPAASTKNRSLWAREGEWRDRSPPGEGLGKMDDGRSIVGFIVVVVGFRVVELGEEFGEGRVR